MAATTDQLIALGEDNRFRQRVRALMLLEAGTIYGEGAGVTNHTARANFASKVAQSPGVAEALAPVVATRTNIVASTVTYDFTLRAVVTDATDAAIRSQINTDWNYLAGV
jgi:hypothetical protein